jgi:hypothetical protein
MSVRQETTYRKYQVLVGFQKDLTGNTLSKALDITSLVESLELTSDLQTKDTSRANNAGQQSKTITGKADFAGTLVLDNPRALSTILLSSILGKGTSYSFGAHSASLWSLTTAVEAGNIVKLSSGEFLVAQNDGTTGATEPTITTEVDYDDLLSLDGDVQWKIRTSLYEGTDYATTFCTEKMIIIEKTKEGCGSSEIFDRVMEGVEFTQYAIGQQNGEVVASQNIPLIGSRERRSTQANYEPITVTSTITPREDYWTNNQCLIRVDGERYGTLLNFMLTYTRNVTSRDIIGEKDEKTTSSTTPTFTGDVTIKLDTAEFEKLRKTDTKSVVITLDALDGESITATMPNCQFFAPTIQAENGRELWMGASLKPLGTPANPMGTFSITTATNFS